MIIHCGMDALPLLKPCGADVLLPVCIAHPLECAHACLAATLQRCNSGNGLSGIWCACAAGYGGARKEVPNEGQYGVQALQETFLIFRLAVLLFSYLGLGTRWTGKLMRLILYSTLLLPGFIQVCNATRPLSSCRCTAAYAAA